MKLKLLLIPLLLLPAACDDKPTPAPKPANPPGGQATPGDLGYGTPGAGCATNRVGKRFNQDGYVWVCKGPAPYKWRRADRPGALGEAARDAAVEVGKRLR